MCVFAIFIANCLILSPCRKQIPEAKPDAAKHIRFRYPLSDIRLNALFVDYKIHSKRQYKRMVPSVSTDTACWAQHVRRKHESVLFNEFSPIGVSTHFRPRMERKSVSERLLRAPNDEKSTKSGNPKHTNARKIENFFPPCRR